MTTPAPDPDALLAALREASGPPPLPPLTLTPPARPLRSGPIGGLIDLARRLAWRVSAPALLDLVAQLERDRERHAAELRRLGERVTRLEQAAGPGDG